MSRLDDKQSLRRARIQAAAIQAHFGRPEFALEKALRGEVLTDEEFTKGTKGLPQTAFELVAGGWRLKEEALRVAGEVQ